MMARPAARDDAAHVGFDLAQDTRLTADEGHQNLRRAGMLGEPGQGRRVDRRPGVSEDRDADRFIAATAKRVGQAR
jgi:hypothetical protein